MKLLAFKRDLAAGKFWGGRKQVYAMQVVEFQKRGLPHAHIAIRMAGQQPSVPDAIDQVISATMPPAHKPADANADEAAWWEGCLGQLPAADPRRRDGGSALKECPCRGHRRRRVVFKHMRHSCVPGRCYKVGATGSVAQHACKYGYPFELSPHTRYNDHGYPLYRRPGPEDANIVAHNVDMLLKYDTHINVEVAHTVLIIKYLHKYMGLARRLATGHSLPAVIVLPVSYLSSHMHHLRPQPTRLSSNTHAVHPHPSRRRYAHRFDHPLVHRHRLVHRHFSCLLPAYFVYPVRCSLRLISSNLPNNPGAFHDGASVLPPSSLRISFVP